MTHPAYILTPFAAAAAFSALVSLLVGIGAYQRLRRNNGTYLSLMMFSLVIWSGFTALDYAATDLGIKIFWTKLEYFGVVFTPLLFLLSALELNHFTSWLQPRRIALLSIIPAMTWLMALTNEHHYLLWTSYAMAPGDVNTTLLGHGPLFWVGNIGYAYLLAGAACVLLFRAALGYLNPLRAQAVLFFLCGLIPLAGSALYVFGLGPIPGYDPSSSLFSLSALLFALSYSRYHMLQLPPLALTHVLDGLPQAVFVTGAQGRLAYLNLAATQLLGFHAAKLIRDPGKGTPKPGEILRLLPQFDADRFAVDLETAAGLRHYSGLRAPLRVTPDGFDGTVWLLQDDTADQQARQLGLREQVRLQRDEMLASLDQDLGQMMDNLQANLALIQTNMQNGNDAASLAQLDQLRLAAKTADRSVRLTLFEILSQSQNPAAFSQVLANYLERFQTITGLPVQYSLPQQNIDGLLEHTTSSVLLSILQERLANAAGAGKASRVQVLFSVANGVLTAVYSDDAQHAQPALAPALQARAVRANAHVDLRLQENGCQMVVSMPVQAMPNPAASPLAGTRVLLAEPQSLFAEAFTRLLEANGLLVLGNAENPAQLPALIRDLAPQLLILSGRWQLPRLAQTLPELRLQAPTLPIVMLFDNPSEDSMRLALQHSAAGLLTQDQPTGQLLAALQDVLAGERAVAPALAQRLANIATGRAESQHHKGVLALTAAGLSEKQIEVLRQMAQGRLYKEIAADLGLSESGIKYHAERMQEVLGQPNRASLIAHAQQLGLDKPA